VDTYVDILEAARRALRLRNEAQRRLEQAMPPETSVRGRECRPDRNAESPWPDGDDGPESWPAMFA